MANVNFLMKSNIQPTAETSSNSSDKTPRPKAKYWLNVGVMTEVIVTNPDGSQFAREEFVSLPGNIGLDTMSRFKITGDPNSEFNLRSAARNALADDWMEEAMKLAPGEQKIYQAGPFAIQLLHVKEEAVPVAPTANPFYRKLSFAA